MLNSREVFFPFDGSYQLWSVPIHGRTRAISSDPAHLSVKSIVIVSVSAHTWSSDVGALLAGALGWGYFDVRHIARLLVGLAQYGGARNAARNHALRAVLADPAMMQRRVWTYFGWPEGPQGWTLEDLLGNASGDYLVVWMRETDELVQAAHIWKSPQGFATPDEVVATRLSARSLIDQGIADYRGPSITVDVELPAVSANDVTTRRNAFMARSVVIAKVLFERLKSEYGGPAGPRPTVDPAFAEYLDAPGDYSSSSSSTR